MSGKDRTKFPDGGREVLEQIARSIDMFARNMGTEPAEVEFYVKVVADRAMLQAWAAQQLEANEVTDEVAAGLLAQQLSAPFSLAGGDPTVVKAMFVGMMGGVGKQKGRRASGGQVGR